MDRKAQAGFIAGFVLFVALIIFLVSGAGIFSTVLTPTDLTAVSYCGESPYFFDRFADQEGYEPNRQCTGVKIEGYRVDVSKTYSGEGGFTCHADYTVYEIEPDGDLNRIVSTGLLSDHEDIELDGLEIEPLSTSQYGPYYQCPWVRTDYNVDVSGDLTFDTDVPEQVEEGETAEVVVSVTNNFDDRYSGDILTDICGGGAFNGQQCTSRSESVSLSPGASKEFTYSIDTDQLSGQLSATTQVDGRLQGVFNGWQGVNVDCDNDNVIERVQDCDGLAVVGVGDSVSADLVEPSVRTLVERVFDAVRSGFFRVVSTIIPE